MDHYIFEEGGGVGQFFLQEFFFVTKRLWMNFISPACNKFLCFVPLCTIFISSAKAVQEFFSYLPNPTPSPEKKRSVP